MKYFLIAGEASGDLHAAHLMRALSARDAAADFRYYGGDEMQATGGTLLCHYRELAYMGFLPVVRHLGTILRGLRECCRAIAEWRPDVVILVDYPGFNLKVAHFVQQSALCPVYYYISPKIWAWKEGRIRNIRRDVSHLYSILPFEVDFFEKKHHYPITYVGNPTVDEVTAYQQAHGTPAPDGHTIALLPGSRRQEIRDNLSRMLRGALPLLGEADRLAVAMAPATDRALYDDILRRSGVDAARVDLIEGETYALLSRATAALVTSGTATLETALFGVPQVVCYYVACGRLVSLLRRCLLKVPHISLVNLICGRTVVPELVADGMTPHHLQQQLQPLLTDTPQRRAMLRGYDEMRERLGAPGAPQTAADDILRRLERMKRGQQR
jgi:lipid-A-disaccharide synthase